MDGFRMKGLLVLAILLASCSESPSTNQIKDPTSNRYIVKFKGDGPFGLISVGLWLNIVDSHVAD